MASDTGAPPNDRFARRLRDPRPLLLDGGLATQLEAQGVSLHPTLWSAACLETDPTAVIAAHRAFLDAGAEILATASYQASREGFKALGLDSDSADELLRRSVTLVRTAIRDAQRPDALVAASLGPWGATQHDGSEYTGRYAIGAAALADFHAQRLAVFDAAGADVIACETLPNGREVTLLAELLESAQTPAWVSFCCRDVTHLHDGTPLADAAKIFRGHRRVLALAINCPAPRHVLEALDTLRSAAPDLPVLVYPNSGERYDARTKSWSGLLATDDAGTAAATWVAAGARGVGGCCRVGPDHIRAMAAALQPPETRENHR